MNTVLFLRLVVMEGDAASSDRGGSENSLLVWSLCKLSVFMPMYMTLVPCPRSFLRPFPPNRLFLPLRASRRSWLHCAIPDRTLLCPSTSSSAGLCAADLPLHVCDANFFSRLLVVVVPLAIRQLDARELGAGLGPRRQKFALSLEFCELQAPAVEFEDVDLLRRVALGV
jgi:hypothetical protein